MRLWICGETGQSSCIFHLVFIGDFIGIKKCQLFPQILGKGAEQKDIFLRALFMLAKSFKNSSEVSEFTFFFKQLACWF